MSKGHVFLAQNSDVNYIRQAYALALSIKIHNKTHNKTCLITNDLVPEEYKHVFDYIVPIPWEDAANNAQWKIENRWKIIYATPFEENIVYDVDMLLLQTNDHWWKYLEGKNLVFTTQVTDYRSNIISSDFYRKTFTLNNLQNLYTGVFYFKKVKETYDFFKWLELVVNNWRPIYKKHLNKAPQQFCSLDVSSALAVKFMDYHVVEHPILTFTHMKPKLQGWKTESERWTNVLNVTLDSDLKLIVGNFLQNNIFHYVEDEFLTNDVINKLEIKHG